MMLATSDAQILRIIHRDDEPLENANLNDRVSCFCPHRDI